MWYLGMVRRVVVSLVLLAACSGREDVVITGIDTSYTPTGIEKRPADMSTLRVQIFAGDERLPAKPVQGDASGRIRVEDVPEGPFVVAVETIEGDRWWWQSESHEVQWNWRYAGRVGARPADVQQPITLAVDGLEAWNSWDSLLAYSLETSTASQRLLFDRFTGTPALEPKLEVGSTSIASTFDWNASDAWSSNLSGRPYLMDAEDTFTLARMRGTIDNGVGISTLTELLVTEPAMQEGGVPLTISGTMRHLQPSATSSFSVDHAAFANALPNFPVGGGWAIAVFQTPPWAGTFSLGPSVILLSGGDSAPSYVEYPLPFDAGWARWVWSSYTFDVYDRTYAISMTPLDGPAYVVAPRTNFATNALFDDQNVLAGIRSVAVVQWDGVSPIELVVPAAEDGFEATVYRLSRNDVRTGRVGALRSGTDTMTVPTGVFDPNERYELQIRVGAEDASGYAYSFSTVGPIVFAPP